MKFSWKRRSERARRRASISLLVLIVAAFTVSGKGQTYSLAEMNTEQIRKLDLDRTVVLIPGGIMEEHGPFLPAFTDGIADQAFTQELARGIAHRPGWKVVMFPQIPLGNGGANNFGGATKRVFPGSYTVSMRTLRSVYMDLADEFGRQGFRWIFLVHNHGDPNHNRALDQASDYFHDTYGGTMVHLFGLKPVMECCGREEKFFNANERAEEGLTVHAPVPTNTVRSCSCAPIWWQADTNERHRSRARRLRTSTVLQVMIAGPDTLARPAWRTVPWAAKNLSSSRRN
jgi:Creatinine amidohydrolase